MSIAPAPPAIPLTAAMIGVLSWRMFFTMLQVMRVNFLKLVAFILSNDLMISSTWPPEQIPLPVPVKTNTLTPPSRGIRRRYFPDQHSLKSERVQLVRIVESYRRDAVLVF
jgi:hypothetical protein